MDIAFDFAIIACLIAALASLLRGRRYVHDEHGQATDEETRAVADSPVAVTSAGDDLEGIQGRVGRVGDPASVGGDLAQRR